MKFGIRAKLFLISIGLVLLAVGVAYSYARSRIEADALARMRDELIVRVQLVTERASVAPYDLDDLQSWDALADRLGLQAASRVTLIARDGHVLGDSMVPPDELKTLENHSLRPEVVEAYEYGIGQTRRHSTTTEREMLYVALPFKRSDSQVGVVRVALAFTQVESAFSTFRRVLGVSAALALAIALVVTFFSVQLASRKARALTDAARRMAAGDLHVRTRPNGHDEFADLGRALDSLARSLSKSLGALSEERDRLSGILESMDEGVLFLDEQGRIALVNPALREMLLLQGGEQGKTLLEVVRHTELKEIFDRAAEDGTDGGEIQLSGLKPRQIHVRAMRLEGGQSGVVALFADVTETRRLENIRREFVANVSHELRTPVTSIRSAAETLQGALQASPEMASRFVDIIDRNAARLQALVEDILSLSSIESRQFRLSIENVDVGSFLRQVCSLFSERAVKREMELRCEGPTSPFSLRVDRRALEHVLSNLIDNAIKYAGSGRRVVVRAESRGDLGILVVEDNGPGIAPKHLSRLFERFYRVDAGRSRDVGGTGLGLSIVKHLVDSMGGTVEVESREGEGATFRVSLPLS